MTFTLTKIKTNNAAFAEDGNNGKNELARILREIADNLEQGYDCGPSFDNNGNLVGRWELK